MSARAGRPGIAALLAALTLPSLAGAQAICSAPHSAPTLAGGGTINTLLPGAGWVQVSLYRQVSTRFFDQNGDRRAFLADGRVRTQSAYLTGALGVWDGVDVWLQLPLHDVRYRDQTGERRRAAAGDPRVAVRVSPELFGLFGIPLALRAGAKFPGTAFPVDATIIPVSEGQRDWELSLESGVTIAAGPLRYVAGWVGYRWREENGATDRDPGDEFFAHLATGGRVGRFHAEIATELMVGRAPRQLGLRLPSAARELVQLQPTVGYRIGRGAVEATALVPLVGSNLPTGMGGSIGYRFAWGGI